MVEIAGLRECRQRLIGSDKDLVRDFFNLIVWHMLFDDLQHLRLIFLQQSFEEIDVAVKYLLNKFAIRKCRVIRRHVTRRLSYSKTGAHKQNFCAPDTLFPAMSEPAAPGCVSGVHLLLNSREQFRGSLLQDFDLLRGENRFHFIHYFGARYDKIFHFCR